jgi:cephalosporin-C deacetylase-like acetyl esterase
MVPDFILKRVSDLDRIRAEMQERAGVEPSEAVRARLVEALGLGRIPRSSVPPRRQGRVERDGYVIEKLVYEALPGLPVPAHLYLPASSGPHPAVVHAPGHWMENAKLEPDLQKLNIRLARSGIAVHCYDTLGQGERRIGWHQHGQLAPLLVGFTSLGVMVTESLVALDVLQSRSDIDSSRLAMTGTSGGGFSTIFATAIDTRIGTAAIACIVNTHLGQIHDAAFGTGWDGWVDLCNQVPGLCAVASMGEILSCAAPRHVAVVHAEDDPAFPLAGARAVAAFVRGRYEAAGAADCVDYTEVAGGHGLHRATRDAVAGALTRQLLGSEAAAEREERLFQPLWEVTHDVARAESPQRPAAAHGLASDGRCLERSVDSNGPLVELARARATRLRGEHPPLTHATLQETLGPFPLRTPLAARVTNHVPVAGGYGQRVVYRPETGIALDALFLLPENWSDSFPPVFVMLGEGGKEQAIASAEAERAREHGCALFVPDLRGTGESAASEFEVATAAWMLDRDLLNQRVWDVVRTVDLLSERYSTGQQIDKDRIVVWGSGAFGLVALIAGALDTRIAATGATGLTSLESLLVENSRVTPMAYRYRLLEYLDVDDLVRLSVNRAYLAATLVDAPASLDAALAFTRMKRLDDER